MGQLVVVFVLERMLAVAQAKSNKQQGQGPWAQRYQCPMSNVRGWKLEGAAGTLVGGPQAGRLGEGAFYVRSG
jgi:hypothetical protein